MWFFKKYLKICNLKQTKSKGIIKNHIRTIQKIERERERLVVWRKSSWVLHRPIHTVSTSQSTYPGSPPVFLGRSLDLLWALWGQLWLSPGLTPACACSQSPQLPPESTVSLITGTLSAAPAAAGMHSLPAPTQPLAPCSGLGPASVGGPHSGACFPPRPEQAATVAAEQWLIRVHLLNRPGERKGVEATAGVFRECLLQLRPAGSCCSLRRAVRSPRRIGRRSGVPAKPSCAGSQEAERHNLGLFLACWQLQPLGLAFCSLPQALTLGFLWYYF